MPIAWLSSRLTAKVTVRGQRSPVSEKISFSTFLKIETSNFKVV